jgi:nucleotide-binding universal stress UspA family protein
MALLLARERMTARERLDAQHCRGEGQASEDEMFKTILVPTSGSGTDRVVFATALAIGRPFSAHLHFFHLHLTPLSAAAQVPHFDYCEGKAVSDELEKLRAQGAELSAAARKHFEDFSSVNRVEIVDTPRLTRTVTASFSEETDEPAQRLLFHARHSDLVVVSRRHCRDRLPEGLLESLLMHGGRPLFIAHDGPPRHESGTVVVGWKETPESARALTAALPLLKLAKRVVLLGVAEEDAPSRVALDDLARQLAWHGIQAEASTVGDRSRPTAKELPLAVAQLRADLLVVGGFGHGPLRESLFGGVTRELIEHADFPVFMLH